MPPPFSDKAAPQLRELPMDQNQSAPPAATLSNPGSLNVTVRLSIMMFLEFFIWGAWYVTVGNYMGRPPHGRGRLLGLHRWPDRRHH